jgi:hypothetical protein
MIVRKRKKGKKISPSRPIRRKKAKQRLGQRLQRKNHLPHGVGLAQVTGGARQITQAGTQAINSFDRFRFSSCAARRSMNSHCNRFVTAPQLKHGVPPCTPFRLCFSF